MSNSRLVNKELDLVTSSMYARSKEFYHMEHAFTVAGYVRNSDPSKKDTEILNAQKEALRAYAREKYGVEIPEQLMFTDAISSLQHHYWERPGLMKAWDEAEGKRFQIILCTEFFRIARKYSEQCAVIQYFKRFGIELVSITEKFEDTPEGRLLMSVQGFLGEIEAQKTMIRTARGRRHRQSLVLTGQGTRTYGLRFADTKDYKNGCYLPNTEMIAIVDGKEWSELDVLSFERKMCLKGWSTNQISLALTNMGIPTLTGKTNWNRITVLQHLTNGNYRGYPYAVNNRWTKEGKPHSRRQMDETQFIPLPEGIYPRICDPLEFELIQAQLRRNKEMASKNNRTPNDTILRTLVYCGICGHKMHVAHHKKAYQGHLQIQRSEYDCKRHDGEDLIHHHCVTIAVHILDDLAWKFAMPYLLNTDMVRLTIASLKDTATNVERVEHLEAMLKEVTDKIINLISVAEDASDDFTRQLYRDKLIGLERERRETETLLSQFANKTEREERFKHALEKFEEWVASQRAFLLDPNYVVSQEDKRAAVVILGVKATVWPEAGYEDRVKLTLMPPDIGRFSDVHFVKAISYSAKLMREQAAKEVPETASS